ncbi:MAG: DUF58 domain-containing protein [Planctomycetes bacterium]|nr:DUF58 domain-containing protein [Planctomycetota bacterium]HON44077.1 DUF58 domain-containing protein [Planctomycetota bacterium]HRU52277.1 DUF58 domain-containing protein [Planctomycetota bacterium]
MNLDFDTSIFDSQFFQILSKIKKQIKKQNQQNKTISPNRGASTDFFIHRPYLLGDDIRKIDWNIYARFQEWIIKENHQENHINWWLLWDISASMQPPKYKISAQIIGFFTCMALLQENSVQISMYHQEKLQQSPLFHKTTHIPQALYFLSWKKPCQSSQNLPQIWSTFLYKKQGNFLLCSDLLDMPNLPTILQKYIHKNKTIYITHIQELSSIPCGYYALQDIETKKIQNIHITKKIQDKYQQQIQNIQKQWNTWSKNNKIHYIPIQTTNTIEQNIHKIVCNIF